MVNYTRRNWRRGDAGPGLGEEGKEEAVLCKGWMWGREDADCD